MIIWIRYRHVKAHYADSPVRVHLINIISFIFGFLSMMGLVIVASFQVSTYCIAGNFRGRKLSRIGRKGAFRGENFRGMLKLVA